MISSTRLAGIAKRLEKSGLDTEFISKVLRQALHDEEVYDLLNAWFNAKDLESKQDYLEELQFLINN